MNVAKFAPLAAAICLSIYWLSVVVMLFKMRQKTGKMANAMPREAMGRIMRVGWYPCIFLLIAALWIVAFRRPQQISLEPEQLRRMNGFWILFTWFWLPNMAWWIALIPVSLAGGAATAMTFICWRRMGRSWRIGIDPGEKLALVSTGPYRLVRHPIYVLRMVINVCAFVMAPTPLVLLTAGLDFLLLQSKPDGKSATWKASMAAGMCSTRIPSADSYPGPLSVRMPSWPVWVHRHAGNGPVTQVSEESPTPIRAVGGKSAHARPHPVRIQLNAFQSLMRQWSKLHPYNAGQVMRITGSPDRDRWKMATESVIRELGLGKPHFLHRERVVEYLPAGEILIESAEGDAGRGGRDLQAFFNEELNRPFAVGDMPIRFCILPADPMGGDETHYLAAVYDHWIADSRAMRELMQRIFERYRTGGAHDTDTLPPLRLQVAPFNTLYRKYVGWIPRLAATRESLKNLWRHRKGYRLNLWDPMNFQSRFLIRELPAGLIDRLYRFAKANNASVNDLFIAVVGQSMGKATASNRLTRSFKLLHFKKRQVGIGTIVDIRDSAKEPLDRVFNLYLSSYSIMMENPEKRSTDELTRSISSQTRRIKEKQLAVKGYAALMTADFWYGIYNSPKFHATLLHKSVPVVAGISNVNMTGTWADPNAAAREESTDEPRVLDYLRISPAGPLIPLVFTLTTIGNRMSLCVTYRMMAFHADRLTTIVDDFIERLETIDRE